MPTWIYLIILSGLYRYLFTKSQVVRYYTRMSLLGISIGFSGLLAMISSLILFPLGKGLYVNDVNAFGVRVLGQLLLGVKGQIVAGKENLKHKTPSVYVMNHQSTLDLFLLAHVLPERTVLTAKKEIFYVPIMGQVFYAGKNMFIDRKNRQSAVAAMDTVADRMIKENLSVLVFPEGTRSHQTDNSLLPFKKGAFHMAKKGKFPIIPIVASTFAPIQNEKAKLFEPGTFQVKVLDPIPVGDESVDELIEITRNKMAEALQSVKSTLSESKKSV